MILGSVIASGSIAGASSDAPTSHDAVIEDLVHSVDPELAWTTLDTPTQADLTQFTVEVFAGDRPWDSLSSDEQTFHHMFSTLSATDVALAGSYVIGAGANIPPSIDELPSVSVPAHCCHTDLERTNVLNKFYFFKHNGTPCLNICAAVVHHHSVQLTVTGKNAFGITVLETRYDVGYDVFLDRQYNFTHLLRHIYAFQPLFTFDQIVLDSATPNKSEQGAASRSLEGIITYNQCEFIIVCSKAFVNYKVEIDGTGALEGVGYTT